MPNETVQYKCPACTAPLHYSQSSGKLECDYCGSSYTLEEMDAMQNAPVQAAEKAFEESPQAEGSWDIQAKDWGADARHLRVYGCPNCGAELICEETTAATACPYCGNPTVIPGQLSGAVKPDYIIPFRKTREDAMAALKKHYSGRPILPRAFMTESHIQEVKGIYVPFWLFDARVEADMTYLTTRSHVHTTSDEVITETDHYLVHRQGSLEFQRVPVDGASKMPNGHMDAIEPYNYQELKPFSLSYLPGFFAEKFDISKDDSATRARSRCAASTENAVRATVLGYETCVPERRNIRIQPGDVKYALLPVWLLSTQWQGKNYLFAMNGQTGKLVGDLPIDKKRLLSFVGIAFAAATALLGWLFV